MTDSPLLFVDKGSHQRDLMSLSSTSDYFLIKEVSDGGEEEYMFTTAG